MKRYLTLLLILIMAVSLFACGQEKSEIPPETADTPGTAVSETEAAEGAVEIDITPPEGWVAVEGSVLPVQYMKGTASFMVKEEPFSGTTLDEVVNEALGMYQDSFDNVKVQGEAEPFTVDDKDARKLTFTCTISNMNMKFLYVYLFVEDRTFVITLGDQESTFDTLAADYETILSDIRFKTQ